MRVSPIQDSFQSGIIGGRVRGRTSIDAYKAGLGQALNWYPLVQGPIRMREGSTYITPVLPANWPSGLVGAMGIRVFTFQRGVDEDAIVEIGEDFLRVVNTEGDTIVGGVTENLIPDFAYANVPLDPYPPQINSTEWSSDQNANVFNTDPGPRLFQLPSGSGGGIVPAGLTLTVGCPGGICVRGAQFRINTDFSPNGAHGVELSLNQGTPIIIPAGSELLLNDWTFTYYQFEASGPATPPGTSALDPPPWADPKLRCKVGTAEGLDDIFTSDVTLDTSQYTDIAFAFIPGATNNEVYISYEYIWTGAVNPVPELLTGIQPTTRAPAINVLKQKYTAPLVGGSGTDVTFASPYSQTQLECLNITMDPGEAEMWFTHPEVETHRLKFASGEWTFEPLSTITLPNPFVAPTPNNWGTGNFPAACAIHEGRLWLGGSPVNPSTLWASRSGDYVDFNNVAPAQADDPLLFPLSASGKIQTLTSRKELVINTDISEVIGTSENGIIAFNDFSFPKQTDWGSNCIQPIVVGRDMIFTSNSKNRLRTFSDEGGTNFGWDGNELSLLAQEIFNLPVRRMEFVDEPAYQACFLLQDGTMGMATFFYPENVIGWWRFTTSYNGDRPSGDTTKPGLGNQFPNAAQQINQIMDITKINTSQGAKLWMVINRVGYAGTQKPGHEILGFDTGLKPALDSMAIRTIDPNLGTISDIDHLTDQSVNIIIERTDDNNITTYTVHPNITVIAGVSSQLETWAFAFGNEVAYVGLFYQNLFKLLPREGVSNRGTSQVSKRRWNKVFLRLNKSYIPLVNGEPPKDRTPSTFMGTGEPRIEEGDVEYSELGSDQGELEIEQDRPLIAEVVAIFGKLTSTEV